MELKKTHIEIMKHTDLNQFYCGDEPELAELCDAGLMKCLGKKSFVPEPYYKLTDVGQEAIFKFNPVECRLQILIQGES